MAEHKENRFLPYLREDRLPHIFCPGCGNGAIINAFLAAMEKAEMDFSVYEKDVLERHQRIPALRELYLRKLDNLCAFQSGKDIWKSRHAQ